MSRSKQLGSVGLAAFLLSFSVYVFSAAPTVGQGHDTGEFTTCAITLGVPHAPGYPLYTMLGYLVSLIPFGEPAWLQNVFSGFSLAVGVGVLAITLTRLTSWIPGLSASLLFAFSMNVWRQAVAAEVFALHLCFLCLLILLATLWADADDVWRKRLVLLASFLLGLGIAHHHTLLLAGPGVLVYGMARRGHGRPWGFSWLNLPVLVITAFLPYLWLMYLSQQDPPLNWGQPNNWESLWYHFARKAYGSLRLNAISDEKAEFTGVAHVISYFVDLVRSGLPLPLFLLILPGLDRCFRAGCRATGFLFGWLFLIYGPIFALWGDQPTQDFFQDLIERFYASSMVGLAGFMAFGMQTCLERFQRHRRLVATLLLLCPLWSLGVNYAKCSQRGEYQGSDFMRSMFACMPPHSLLVLQGDLTAGVAYYLQMVLHVRPDVLVVLPGLTGVEWYQRTLPTPYTDACARAPQGHHPAQEAIMRYAYDHGEGVYLNYNTPNVPGHYEPEGMLWRWFPTEASPDPAVIRKGLLDCLATLESSPHRGEFKLNWHQNYWTRYFLWEWLGAYERLAGGLFEKQPDKAEEAMLRVIEISDLPDPKDLANLALLRIQQHHYKAAEEAFQQALKRDPEYVIALAGMSSLCRVQNRPEEADYYRQEARRVREFYRQ